MWRKVTLNIVEMPPCGGFLYLVVARCDLSGWVEVRSLRYKTMRAVVKFIWEKIVCRYKVFGRLVVNGGKENTGAVEELTTRYGIHRI